jgi:hypothetical protein
MALDWMVSFKMYFMPTRKENEPGTGSPKEGSRSELLSDEFVTRQGSTEHNDYRIMGSDSKKHETGSPGNEEEAEEHGSPAGQ